MLTNKEKCKGQQATVKEEETEEVMESSPATTAADEKEGGLLPAELSVRYPIKRRT